MVFIHTIKAAFLAAVGAVSATNIQHYSQPSPHEAVGADQYMGASQPTRHRYRPDTSNSGSNGVL